MCNGNWLNVANIATIDSGSAHRGDRGNQKPSRSASGQRPRSDRGDNQPTTRTTGGIAVWPRVPRGLHHKWTSTGQVASLWSVPITAPAMVATTRSSAVVSVHHRGAMSRMRKIADKNQAECAAWLSRPVAYSAT